MQLDHVMAASLHIGRNGVEPRLVEPGIAHARHQESMHRCIVALQQQILGQAPDLYQTLIEGTHRAIEPADQHAIGCRIERGPQLGQQGFQPAFCGLSGTAIDHGHQQRSPARRQRKGRHPALHGDELPVSAQQAGHGMNAQGHCLFAVGPEALVLGRCRQTLDGQARQLLARHAHQRGGTQIGEQDGASARIHKPDGLLQPIKGGLPENILRTDVDVHNPASTAAGLTALSKK